MSHRPVIRLARSAIYYPGCRDPIHDTAGKFCPDNLRLAKSGFWGGVSEARSFQIWPLFEFPVPCHSLRPQILMESISYCKWVVQSPRFARLLAGVFYESI